MKTERWQAGNQTVFLTMGEDDFNCPECNFKQCDPKLEKKIKPPKWFYYKKCINCKCLLGISVDYRGDVAVWLKKNEQLK